MKNTLLWLKSGRFRKKDTNRSSGTPNEKFQLII